MENYVKEILFGYPLLKTIEEDYALHIKNKAVLSHNCATSAEKLAEYLAGEILAMRSLENLKRIVGNVLDKLSLEEENGADAPCVRVYRPDGSYTGLAFHGVPGGHEFTSFVLGLYNAAGPGQPLEEDVRSAIGKVGKTDIQVLVSLSCTMCPELVMAAQRIAAMNENVTAEVYDLTHFPEIRDKYNVMSVPCLLINGGETVTFGKKNIRQLLEILK